MKKVLGNIDMKLEEVDGIWTWQESKEEIMKIAYGIQR